MKYQIMLGILFTLLAQRRVCAAELAAKYDISVRTVYRYTEEMIVAGIPIGYARGTGGGIYISDAFKLPKGFMTQEEYSRTMDAVLAMLEQTGDPALRRAADKLASQMKTERKDFGLSGYILVDSGTWGDERKFSEKLSLLEHAAEQCEEVEIDYIDREGKSSHRAILPHLLVYKQNLWYVYAYCRNRDAFRLFKVGRIRTIVLTGRRFERVPFLREEIPLNFCRDGGKEVEARFAISPEALPFAEEWLGIENVRREGDSFVADAVLPDGDSLVLKILSAGAGLCVLSPASLRERVRKTAEQIAAMHR